MRLLDQATSEAERQDIRGWVRFLDDLGNGVLNDEENTVPFYKPSQCRLVNGLADVDAMLNATFNVPDRGLLNQSDEFWASKCLVAPRHVCVDFLNDRMLARLPVDPVECYSVDKITDEASNHMHIGSDFLNRQSLPGFPPHKLVLKRGAVIMLLRNLDRSRGMVNGARMVITEIRRNRLLRAKLLTGTHAGRIVLIPRIYLKPPATRYPFEWQRLQFPVKLAYCMTINKYAHRRFQRTAMLATACGDTAPPQRPHRSQGQTLESIAVFLALMLVDDDGALIRVEPLPCFAHGQLLVALSRVGHPDRVHVHLDATQHRAQRTASPILRNALLPTDADELHADQERANWLQWVTEVAQPLTSVSISRDLTITQSACELNQLHAVIRGLLRSFGVEEPPDIGLQVHGGRSFGELSRYVEMCVAHEYDTANDENDNAQGAFPEEADTARDVHDLHGDTLMQGAHIPYAPHDSQLLSELQAEAQTMDEAAELAAESSAAGHAPPPEDGAVNADIRDHLGELLPMEELEGLLQHVDAADLLNGQLDRDLLPDEWFERLFDADI